MADSTVVVLTSDHGDMLGDRGNWFKMSFFERSVRVPLILAGAGVGHGVVANPVSHVDLLPTLVDIARANVPPAPLPGDGNSLWEAATGGAHGFHETFSEYTAEMTSHPMFMIRRGEHKYVHCDTDPPLLFDLRADPQEQRNLAGDPAHADLAVDFGMYHILYLLIALNLGFPLGYKKHCYIIPVLLSAGRRRPPRDPATGPYTVQAIYRFRERYPS